MTTEEIDHPAHYNTGCIEVIEAIYAWQLNFSLGCAVKYIARAGHKESRLKDLLKAKRYLEFEIAELRKHQEVVERT